MKRASQSPNGPSANGEDLVPEHDATTDPSRSRIKHRPARSASVGDYAKLKRVPVHLRAPVADQLLSTAFINLHFSSGTAGKHPHTQTRIKHKQPKAPHVRSTTLTGAEAKKFDEMPDLDLGTKSMDYSDDSAGSVPDELQRAQSAPLPKSVMQQTSASSQAQLTTGSYLALPRLAFAGPAFSPPSYVQQQAAFTSQPLAQEASTPPEVEVAPQPAHAQRTLFSFMRDASMGKLSAAKPASHPQSSSDYQPKQMTPS